MKNLYAKYIFYSATIIIAFSPKSSFSQTFYEDVAPVIYEKCTNCHRDCSVAFPNLITYSDCIDNILDIQLVINGGAHVSWPPDTAYHHFQHEPFLSASEVQLIDNWINNGMPEGNPNNAPPGPVYANESFIGDPDTVLTMSQACSIPGDKDDCKVFVIPTGFQQQKFVRALEFNPCTLKNIHHAIISVDTTGLLALKEMATPGYGLDRDSVATSNPSRLLTIYHPNDRVTLFPLGKGYRFPPQSDLILEVHYLATNVPFYDSIAINVFYDDTTVHQEVHTIAIDENDIGGATFILPGSQIKTLNHSFTFCGHASLLSISAEMNAVGKSMKVFSVNDATDTVPLINVPDWMPTVKYLYSFPSPVQIDSNAILHSEGIFDNTVNNPNNPNNPPITITNDCFTCDNDFAVYLQFTGSNCSPTPDCFSTEVDEIPAAAPQSVFIFPNPATTSIQLHLPYNHSTTLTLFNLLGEKVKEQTITGSDITIDVSELPAGMYVVRASGCTGKFVKE